MKYREIKDVLTNSSKKLVVGDNDFMVYVDEYLTGEQQELLSRLVDDLTVTEVVSSVNYMDRPMLEVKLSTD